MTRRNGTATWLLGSVLLLSGCVAHTIKEDPTPQDPADAEAKAELSRLLGVVVNESRKKLDILVLLKEGNPVAAQERVRQDLGVQYLTLLAFQLPGVDPVWRARAKQMREAIRAAEPELAAEEDAEQVARCRALGVLQGPLCAADAREP